MTWHYQNKPYTETPEQYQGFVYCIYDNYNNRKYIGQKTFWTTKKLPPLKGNKNKRHRRIETQWRDYWGSSNALLKEVELKGEGFFKREILYLCANKNQMNYFETREQFDRDVLFKDEYYNGIINCRITAKGLNT